MNTTNKIYEVDVLKSCLLANESMLVWKNNSSV